jgi:hypothetical protein
MGIVRARTLSHATTKNIRQNLFLSFADNVAGIPLAAGVLYPFFGLLLSPVVAAAATALSSPDGLGGQIPTIHAARRPVDRGRSTIGLSATARPNRVWPRSTASPCRGARRHASRSPASTAVVASPT